MRLLPAVLLTALCPPAARPEPPPPGAGGLELPTGFTARLYADHDLANDIYCMAIDDRGRVTVSGRGYVRVLADRDGDGRADEAVPFSDVPRNGAQGLFWDGDVLYAVGDQGVYRFRDADRDGRADGEPELLVKLRTGGEHDAHAVRRGPDGWFYVLCGNLTGVRGRFPTAETSPVREPVAGCLLRFRPDFRHCEVVADGFRNAYDFDFDAAGEVFTYDSDNERCVGLPWYEPTRFYHVLPGGHHGWLSPQRAETWRRPPYFPDVVPPLAGLERGSPTGVVCYRHTQFPEAYRGGCFAADWTFGRVWFLPLKPSGAGYATERQLFLRATGDNGFAPTALVVHPQTGELFVAIGGRGTRGAVYRIRYEPEGKPVAPVRPSPLTVRKRSLAWESGQKEDLLRRATGGEPAERLRALQHMGRHFTHFSRAESGRVIRANLGHPDRLVRLAAIHLTRQLDPGSVRRLGGMLPGARERATFAVAVAPGDPERALELALPLITDPRVAVGTRLDAARAVQLALGDLCPAESRGTVWEGYTPGREVSPETAKRVAAVRDAFPSGNPDLDRELSRVLAVVRDGAPGSLDEVSRKWSEDSHPVEDIHYLIVAARLRAERSPEVTRRTAAALLGLDRKFERLGLTRDRNWPARVRELADALYASDPALPGMLLGDPSFGRPGHALLVRGPGFDRRRAAERFATRARAEQDFAWSPEAVALLGALPDEQARPVLDQIWGEGGFEDVILPMLAKRPRPADREKFLRGLRGGDPRTARAALDGLGRLPGQPGEDELPALVTALGRLPDGKAEKPVREALAARLRQITGANLGPDAPAWRRWLAENRPALAAELRTAGGVDLEGWRRRLAAIDWAAGDVGRGERVARRANCLACHVSAGRVGPDLDGVAQRFSRDDLFAAILDPGRDIPSRYRGTEIETARGLLYRGVVIYDAVDGLILQTGPTETVRLKGSEIISRRPSEVSLMPAGLLDEFSDRDLADLYAYLRTLGRGDPGGRRTGPNAR